jgi:site-specific DNA recombinase
VEHKILLIGSMFPEKIIFDREKYRTNSYNKVLDWIFQNTNGLHEQKKKKQIKNLSLPFPYPEPGSNADTNGQHPDFRFSGTSGPA